jgi:hypothetical protein
MTAFVANTNVLDLIGLKNEIAGTFINNAAVTVTIKDDQGVNVSGATWPMTMTYVTGSDGDYRAFLSEDLAFVAKGKYIAAIDADGGTNLVGHWELNFKPLARTVSEIV